MEKSECIVGRSAGNLAGCIVNLKRFTELPSCCEHNPWVSCFAIFSKSPASWRCGRNGYIWCRTTNYVFIYIYICIIYNMICVYNFINVYNIDIAFLPIIFWDFFKFKSNSSNWKEDCWTVELPPRHWHLWQPVPHLGSGGCLLVGLINLLYIRYHLYKFNVIWRMFANGARFTTNRKHCRIRRMVALCESLSTFVTLAGLRKCAQPLA